MGFASAREPAAPGCQNASPGFLPFPSSSHSAHKPLQKKHPRVSLPLSAPSSLSCGAGRTDGDGSGSAEAPAALASLSPPQPSQSLLFPLGSCSGFFSSFISPQESHVRVTLYKTRLCFAILFSSLCLEPAQLLGCRGVQASGAPWAGGFWGRGLHRRDVQLPGHPPADADAKSQPLPHVHELFAAATQLYSWKRKSGSIYLDIPRGGFASWPSCLSASGRNRAV